MSDLGQCMLMPESLSLKYLLHGLWLNARGFLKLKEMSFAWKASPGHTATKT